MLALPLFAGPARAGKLNRASEAARSDTSSSTATTSSECEEGGSTSSSGDDLFGRAALYVIASPWILPYAVVEDGRPAGAAGRVRFAPYPYSEDSAGVLHEAPAPPLAPAPFDDSADVETEVSPPTASATEGVATGGPVAVELGLERGIGVDEGVIRSGFHARALFPFRLGLDTGWSLYRESQGASVDQLGLGREHLNFRFAESRRVHFQTGIGPQHL
ncbi:MAG TPA: hypothetical protein VF395_21325, partial [Polyangiaceae bacterium]